MEGTFRKAPDVLFLIKVGLGLGAGRTVTPVSVWIGKAIWQPVVNITKLFTIFE